MATQKAWRLHSYGGPECMQLDDIPIPQPGPSQALVAVSYAAINPFDFKLREGLGQYMGLNLPTTLGVDFVGTVVALGEKASRLKIGDRVMTLSTSLGAFAEHIAVDESILALVPSDLNDATAATLPIPGSTAWQALHTAGEIKPGMTVLINGASGVCGAFAVQFAKAEGARVIGTGSGKNRAYVMDLGADEFIDYQTQDIEHAAKDVDLVLDFVLVGSSATTNKLWQVLKPHGALVSVADPTVSQAVPDGIRSFFPTIKPEASQLETIAKQRASGKLKSKVAQTFKRSELVKAMEISKAGGTTGRMIVDFKSE